jgi:hypothetical protein
MTLRFVGIDPTTGGGNCPSVWVDGESGDLIIQGWEVTDQHTREEIASRSPIADNESVIRVPARMRSMIAAACGIPES